MEIFDDWQGNLSDPIERDSLANLRVDALDLLQLHCPPPAVYELFGIGDTYDYMATSLGEDPAPLIEAGTCSEDWLRRLGGDPFALVCELPYYTAPALDDTAPAGCSRRDAIVRGLAAAEAIHARVAETLTAIGAAPDHRLMRSVVEYVRKTPKRLAAERAHAAADEYAQEATGAQVCDARLCTPFHHLLYLGEAARVAALAGASALAERVDATLEALAGDLVRTSALRVLPIRPLVSVQAGTGLLALAATGDR